MSKDMGIIKAINSVAYYQKLNLCLTNLSDVINFPVLKKSIVSSNLQEFLSVYKTSNLLEIHTSGSTGIPLTIFWNHLDYYNSMSEIWRLRKELGVLPNDRFVSSHLLYNNGYTNITNKMIIQKNNLSLSKIFFDDNTFLLYYKNILDFNPKFLLLPPSFLYGFIMFLEQHNWRLPKSIVLIELTGEYCNTEIFNFFSLLYPNINWRITYGMQEFNVIAYGTPTGLKILDKNVHVEILNGDYSPCKICDEGKIYITGLKNMAMPLVKYDTEDYGYFDKNGCLNLTKARSNDSITINGITYDGSVFWLIILEISRILNLKIFQFQVVYETNQSLSFYLNVKKTKVKEKTIIECVKTTTKKILNFDINIDIDIDIYFVDQIVAEKSQNKVKYFINKTN